MNRMKLTTHKGFSVIKEFQWEAPHIVQKVSAIIAELHRQNTSLFASLKVLTLDPQISVWLSEHDPKALEQAQNRSPRSRPGGAGNETRHHTSTRGHLQRLRAG